MSLASVRANLWGTLMCFPSGLNLGQVADFPRQLYCPLNEVDLGHCPLCFLAPYLFTVVAPSLQCHSSRATIRLSWPWHFQDQQRPYGTSSCQAQHCRTSVCDLCTSYALHLRYTGFVHQSRARTRSGDSPKLVKRASSVVTVTNVKCSRKGFRTENLGRCTAWLGNQVSPSGAVTGSPVIKAFDLFCTRRGNMRGCLNNWRIPQLLGSIAFDY